MTTTTTPSSELANNSILKFTGSVNRYTYMIFLSPACNYETYYYTYKVAYKHIGTDYYTMPGIIHQHVNEKNSFKGKLPGTPKPTVLALHPTYSS